MPCFNEPHVLEALKSIYACTIPDCLVEVIVVVNHGKNEDQHVINQNRQSADTIERWFRSNPNPSIEGHVIRAFDLEDKIAGVGLARKIGMDDAVRRFEDINKKRGVIVCFDADCTCSSNYLQEIYRAYHQRPEINAGLLYFEHPLSGNMSNETYDAIINYELHLRYYKNALGYANFPYSYHTVGSCITVTSEAYQKQGGMNKRKAGEDFYFLQKIFSLGKIENITEAKVIPSPRSSDRVPFGTGKAVHDILLKSSSNYYTYNPKIFMDLRRFINRVPELFKGNMASSAINNLPQSIRDFMAGHDYFKNLQKIIKNNRSEKQFVKSFFQWFNGFTVLKYVHFARDEFFEHVEVFEAAEWVIVKNKGVHPIDKKDALFLLREIDRSD